MPIDVYFNFNGNAREAIAFYADAFEAEAPAIIRFGDSPPNPDHPLPEEAKDLVMHANMKILGSTVMFSDVFPGMAFTVGSNITLSISTNDEEQLKRIFHKLKVGGEVNMELQETFWSKLYGQVTDPYGVLWQLNLGEA
ncbi:VOC family protein [Paenibacillus protaetiae]|uniref:VOC family protein n=1 Tax=Paenibacillus protaetiae TaxID=2509456 RepID=A0A4P6ET24_9BACL|nr:VOC family protein [Paenibacillus protaetiae]QAY66084.1 VOC family protein [Paenibacillus protaetiae]